MKKVLLVIPEKSYKSNDFVLAAKRLKIPFSIITDSQQVSESLTDNIIISNFEKEISLEVLEKLKDITHVLPVDHSSLEFASKLKDLLSATGNTYNSVMNAMDKYKSRIIFNEVTEVKINNSYVNDTEDLLTFMSKFNTGVLKPTKGTASNKVIKVTHQNMDQPLMKNIIKDCNKDELIIEEFVEGDEYAFEGMLIDSKLSKFVVFEKPLVFVEPYFEESIYITPSNLSNVIVEEAQSKIEKACQKLGLTNGPIHAEFKIANDEVFLIEINPRMIGGLCSRCLSFGLFKQSLEELILLSFSTGNFKQIELLSNYVGVLMLPVPKSGKFRSINHEEIINIENVSSVDITVSKNSSINMPPNGERYLGFVFSQGENKLVVMQALKKALKIAEPIIDS
ncbi:MAG: ATP-grasp domain-containing protein [Candidatus Actinomarina sp.]|jgi:predicted ATP-grasp superfamily ATP-dependent carboligase|nr:ATP-grasp domain-containing protein [Candidatus Actinomarina sp.]|tara:strand:- start:1633 stop:2817 length:1185 start_codon:yes stop_codon:yes gene_type:complete